MIASWEVHTSDPDTLTSRMKVKTLSLFSVLCTIVGVHTSEDVMSEEQEPVHWLSWQQCLLCQHTLTYFSASLSSQRVPLLRKEKSEGLSGLALDLHAMCTLHTTLPLLALV